MSRRGIAIYALDPGTEQSALLSIEPDGVVTGRILTNESMLTLLDNDGVVGQAHLVVEEIQSYGMAVGREVFQTVFWSGRFVQAWERRGEFTWSLLPRRDVKLALCGSPRAKDANIRQALIDRYGGQSCIKKGGPLAGIKSHLWSALALAVTYQEQQRSC